MLRTLFLAALAALATGRAAASDDQYAEIRPTLQTCFACHGADGASAQDQFPILAGQHFYYLYVQLKDYKSGLRENAVMSPIAVGLEKDQMQALAKYFSEQPWPEHQRAVDPQTAKAGKTVIASGQCVACHLGDFEGNSRNPRLAGQHPRYLTDTLLAFKTKARNNSPAKSTLMGSYSEEEIRDVSDYLGTLKVVD